MTTAQLYCQSGCAACAGLTRYLGDAGVLVEVHDVTTEPDAFDRMVALGYCSLPVLVAPDGSSGVGAGAAELARALSKGTGEVVSNVHPAINETEV
ncbi:MAG: hypothetical protein NVS3B21_30010 [Acidimicrobiales bacterium]